MTKEEIDQTIDFLIEAKKAGQFRAFWKDFNESVNLMASGEVVIQSMWSPAVTAVRSQGHRPASTSRSRKAIAPGPAGFGMPSTSQGKTARRRLRVHQLVPVGLGRRLPQPPGLLLGGARHRQGQHGRPTSGPSGWKASPPRRTSRRRNGEVMEKAGAVRDGGSFYERMGAVACWNAVMDEDTLHGPEVERVHRGLTLTPCARRRTASAAAARVGSRSAIRRRERASRPAVAVSAGGAAGAGLPAVPGRADRSRSSWSASGTTTTTQIIPAFTAAELRASCCSRPVTWRTYLADLKFCRHRLGDHPGDRLHVAYFLAFHVRSPTWQMVLFLVCTIPFWTSNVIRMISWIPLLGRNGAGQLGADRSSA